MYITRLASKEIFSPSNKIHREVGLAKDLSAPRYQVPRLRMGGAVFTLPHTSLWSGPRSNAVACATK